MTQEPTPEPTNPSRYRPGSRRKQHHIVARGVRRDDPDIQRFARALIESAMRQAQRETEAEREAEAQTQQEAEQKRQQEGDANA